MMIADMPIVSGIPQANPIEFPNETFIYPSSISMDQHPYSIKAYFDIDDIVYKMTCLYYVLMYDIYIYTYTL